jgi:hypothetical protein
MNKPERAREQFIAAHDILANLGPDQHSGLPHVLKSLVKVCTQLNKSEEAARWRQELASLETTTQPASSLAFPGASSAAATTRPTR